MNYFKIGGIYILAFLLIGLNAFSQNASPNENGSNKTFLHSGKQQEHAQFNGSKTNYLDDGPLYIVSADGKEFRTTDKTAFLPYVENTQIESINILKNEAAVEQYGEVGKNGVVQINLKKDVLKTLPKKIKAKFK